MAAELSPQDRRAVRKLAERVARVEKAQRRGQRTAQGPYRSLEGGSQEVYDTDGVLRGVVGEQADGTYTRIDLNAPAPVQPAEPTVEGRAGILIVSSYGLAADLSDWPLDFAHFDVHVGAPGFTRSAASKVAEFTNPDGGVITLALDAGTYEAVLVAVNTSGTESDESPRASATVTAPTVGAGGVTTYHADEPPVGLDASDDGALWYDTNAGNLPHRWDGTALDWVPLKFGAEALAVLRAVSIEGASIRVGADAVGSIAEPFAGTSLPAGWVSTKGDGFGGPGSAAVPGASVVDSGIPAGGSGSALLIDYGPAGGEDNNAIGTVVPDLDDAADAEVEIRFHHEFATDALVGPRLAIAIRRQGGTAGSSTEDALLFRLDHRAPGSFFPYSVVSRVNASDSPLLSFTLDTDTSTAWHIAKLRILAGQVEAKLWRDGDPEPEWTSTQQAGVLTPGEVALVWEQTGSIIPSEAQRTWVDYVNVTTYESGLTVNPDGSGTWPAIEGPIGSRLDALEAADTALDGRLDTLEAVDPWHTVGAAGQPAFQNGWSAQSEAVQFRKNSAGDVYIRGRVKPGSGTIFTLPAGYRPSDSLLNVAVAANGDEPANIDITTAGAITAAGYGTASWVSLSGLVFSTV